MRWCTAKPVIRAKDASSLSPSSMHHKHLCLRHGAPEISSLRTMGQQLLILLASLRWEWKNINSSVLLSRWCLQSLCVNYLVRTWLPWLTWPSCTTSPSWTFCGLFRPRMRKRHAHCRISQHQQEQLFHLKASRISKVQARQLEFKAVLLGVTSNCMRNLLQAYCKN